MRAGTCGFKFAQVQAARSLLCRFDVRCVLTDVLRSKVGWPSSGRTGFRVIRFWAKTLNSKPHMLLPEPLEP